FFQDGVLNLGARFNGVFFEDARRLQAVRESGFEVFSGEFLCRPRLQGLAFDLVEGLLPRFIRPADGSNRRNGGQNLGPFSLSQELSQLARAAAPARTRPGDEPPY